MKKTKRAELMSLYNSTRATCRCCGTALKTMFGDPLGQFFVLSTSGEFFCMDCDCLVPGEEIFEPDFYPEEDCED